MSVSLEIPRYMTVLPGGESGARPVQILGRDCGRLIGWARSFSDRLTVANNAIMGSRRVRLTRIAGRDVSLSDGLAVGTALAKS